MWGRIIVTTPTQLNWVGFDMKMGLNTHPTHPTQTQLPSQGASDQALMVPNNNINIKVNNNNKNNVNNDNNNINNNNNNL